MKSTRLFLAVATLVLLAGCVTMIPVRITAEKYPSIGLICAYPDEATLSVGESFFSIPKNSALPLPDMGNILARVLAEKLTAGGYKVRILPVKAHDFWTAFEAAAETKEGSGWHLGVGKNTLVTVRNLQQQGLDLSNVDAVLVVGPSEFYYDSRFLSRKGTGLELPYVEKTPDKVGVSIGASAIAINAKTWELTGGGSLQKWQTAISVPPGKTLATLSEAEKQDLIRQLSEKAGPVFQELVQKLR